MPSSRKAQLWVAPHVGAWIEIVLVHREPRVGQVAPHVGAWIEMLTTGRLRSPSPVAPHVGAWIEINLF